MAKTAKKPSAKKAAKKPAAKKAAKRTTSAVSNDTATMDITDGAMKDVFRNAFLNRPV